jgi:hypothetical protein
VRGECALVAWKGGGQFSSVVSSKTKGLSPLKRPRRTVVAFSVLLHAGAPTVGQTHAECAIES